MACVSSPLWCALASDSTHHVVVCKLDVIFLHSIFVRLESQRSKLTLPGSSSVSSAFMTVPVHAFRCSFGLFSLSSFLLLDSSFRLLCSVRLLRGRVVRHPSREVDRLRTHGWTKTSHCNRTLVDVNDVYLKGEKQETFFFLSRAYKTSLHRAFDVLRSEAYVR